jgi:NAD(P)-dependent dehydrogenase (short-subunit alcohol dehydrogenase family)
LFAGIGQGIAVAFVKDGCRKIALCDRNAAGLEETKRLIADVASDCETLCVLVDLQEEGQVEEMVQKTVDAFGRVDYAVNTAGQYSHHK